MFCALFWCRIRKKLFWMFISISLHQHTATSNITIQQQSLHITSTEQTFNDGDLSRIFGLKPIKLQWVINICLPTAVWFIASIKYLGQYRVTFFIVLHFVKRFVWCLFVFTQYSYYFDLFCLGTASCICECHRHWWVCYIDTTIITVLRFVWDRLVFTQYSYYRE